MADEKVKRKVVRKPMGPKTVYIVYDRVSDTGQLQNARLLRKADEILELVENGAKYTKIVLPAAQPRTKAA